MKIISQCGWAVALAGFLWAATSVGAGPAQPQPSIAPGAAAASLTEVRLAGLEKQMWEMVNRDRQDPANSAETGGRARPLEWNQKLAAVARAHSRDMVEKGYFAHTDPQGRTVVTRLKGAGIPWQALAENIADNFTIAGAESSFMSEPRFKSNHRGNILSVTATDVGIGIAPAPTGNLYITQDFVATPPGRAGVSSAR